MAETLQATIKNIQSKALLLTERYALVADAKQKAENRIIELEQEIRALKSKIESLESENRFLKIAGSIAPNPEQTKKTRELITAMLRDIDKSIAQLSDQI